MKARLLVPLFATLILAGTARSQNPGQPPNAGPLPGGPMADRMKHRIEELRRDGKNDEAERLERHVREMWARHRGSPQGERREQSHSAPPSGNPAERREHLAEAARHLHAAGIDVSPEQLERLGQKFHGTMESRRQGAPGNFGPTPGPGFRAPMGNPTPGVPPEIAEIHNQMRALANQVQELRRMMQSQHGMQPQAARRSDSNRGEHRDGGHQDRDAHAPKDGERHADGPHTEQHRDRPPVPEASREHRDGPSRPQGDNGPRRENRTERPPGDRSEGNPPPRRESPRNDGPAPGPAQ